MSETGTTAKKRRLDESGNAAVEFALLLPVLLLILVGAIVFGLTLNQYIMLWNGVSVAAGQFAISAVASSAPAGDAVTALVKSAPTLAPADITVTLTVGTNAACFSGAANSSTTAGNTECSTQLQASQGGTNLAIVAATYPCSLTVMQYDFFPDCKLSAQASEQVQ
jgi:Flp pilus assembly protein TadG